MILKNRGLLASIRAASLAISAFVLSGCFGAPNTNFSPWCESGSTCGVSYSQSSYIVATSASVSIAAPSINGSQPSSYSVSPSLPSGLSLNPNTGAITGSSSTASSATAYMITANNSQGAATATIVIEIFSTTPTQLAWTGGPSSLTAGNCVSYTVSAENSLNQVTNASSAISITLSGSGSGTFYSDPSCTISTSSITIGSGAGSQVVYFRDTTAQGPLVFSAVSTGLTSGTTSVTISAGTAIQLAWVTQPSATGTAASALATQPKVQAEDAFGNVVTGYSTAVSLLLFTTSSCGTASTPSVSGNSATPSSGVATFTSYGINIDGNYYYEANSGSLSTACSGSAIAITGSTGTTTQLAWVTQPSLTGTPASALSTQPKVQAEDVYGNVVTGYSGSVTMSLFSNSSCTTSASPSVSGSSSTDSSGVATFASYGINTDGNYYYEAGDGTHVTACSSSAIAITGSTGTATQLGFSTLPGTVEGTGIAFATQPVVEDQDAYGNLVSSASDTISLSTYVDSGCTIATNGTLSSASGLNTVAGAASFSGVTYKGNSGQIYLKASGTAGYTAACTGPFMIDGWVQLSANNQSYFTCALSAASNVYCWGLNGNGQLGDNTSTGPGSCSGSACSATPAEVEGVGGLGFLSGIVSIATGADHACALGSSGNVYCWGFNGLGQLGNNTTTEENTPVEVEGVGGSGFLSSIVNISVGSDYSCALNSSGNVYCWGYNADGELGNNSTTEVTTPVEVEGVGGSGYLSGIVAVATGGFHVCAISSAGNAYCWGSNLYGELGNNTGTNEKTPVEVVGVGGSGFLSGIVNLAAGDEHSCAINSSGNAYCWGYNSYGQLGNNTTTEENAPVELEGVGGSGFLAGLVGLSAGYEHTCALGSTGNAYCWGYNGTGQLGNDTTTQESTPVEVVGMTAPGDLSGIVSLTAGAFQTCALGSEGYVYCWGDNNNGQLGNNSTTNALIPVEVQAIALAPNAGSSFFSTQVITPALIATGGNGPPQSCAVTSSGNVKCWGYNFYGEKGDGTTNTIPPTTTEVVGVGGTGNLKGVLSVATGATHTCALNSSGNVYCWGASANGQLGNGNITGPDSCASNACSTAPVEVEGVGGSGYLSGVIAIASGDYHTCALNSSGNVYCWGFNYHGELGNGSTTLESTPVEVEGVGGSGDLSNIVAISGGGATGADYTCALNSSGNVYCWGDNASGELGDNTNTGPSSCASAGCSLTPVEVEGVGGSGNLSGIISITTGYEHACALNSSGNAYCWGANSSGQLGNNTTTEENTPVEVVGVGGSGDLSGILSVSAGDIHTCALNSSGNAYCWGDNAYGELGNDTMTSSLTPLEVVGVSDSGDLSGVVSIASGYYYSCALSSSGNAYCWGMNSDGELGDDQYTGPSTCSSSGCSLTPVEVDDVGGSSFLSGI